MCRSARYAYSKHALLQFDQSSRAWAHVSRWTHPVDRETRAYGVPVDRAVSHRLALTLALCTLLRFETLPFTLIRESIAHLHTARITWTAELHALQTYLCEVAIHWENSQIKLKLSLPLQVKSTRRLAVMRMLRQNTRARSIVRSRKLAF